MTLPPQQLEAATEYFRILDGIAKRLILEGRARIEKGKLIIIEEEEQ